MPAGALTAGTRFVARTSLGPGFDDPMRDRRIRRPDAGSKDSACARRCGHREARPGHSSGRQRRSHVIGGCLPRPLKSVGGPSLAAWRAPVRGGAGSEGCLPKSSAAPLDRVSGRLRFGRAEPFHDSRHSLVDACGTGSMRLQARSEAQRRTSQMRMTVSCLAGDVAIPKAGARRGDRHGSAS